jgi:hypothetical protein
LSRFEPVISWIQTRSITASANFLGEFTLELFNNIVTFIYNYILFSANIILFK